MGASVKARAANRLGIHLTDGPAERHMAAVWPAIQSVRKIMPAKAVDEWPDGNDIRPSRIDDFFLFDWANQLNEDFTVDILTQRRAQRLHPICTLRGSQDEVSLRNVKGRHRYASIEARVPTLCLKYSVIIRARPLWMTVNKEVVGKDWVQLARTDQPEVQVCHDVNQQWICS